MNAPEFDKIVNETCDSIRKVLSSKAKEYAKGDRLYNFKRAAEINHTTPELALAGMLVKHWVSVLDLIEGTLENSEVMVNEKIGDTINYLILLKAILREKRNQLISPLMSAGGLGKGYIEINPDTPSVSGHGAAFAEMVKAATEQAEMLVTEPENEYDKFIRSNINMPSPSGKYNVIGRPYYDWYNAKKYQTRALGVVYESAVTVCRSANRDATDYHFSIEPCSNQQ